MNKNMNNQKGKGSQDDDKMQNQENREKETQPARGGTNLNKEKETQRVESWSKQSADREKGIHPVESSEPKKPNREKENQRVESWSKQSTDREKGIHPVEPSAEKSMNREKETHRMVSWNKNIKDREEEIQAVERSAVETPNMEKKTTQAKSWTRENERAGDGLNRPSSSTHGMHGHDASFKTSNVQVNPMPGGNVDELKSTSGVGTALYAVAALLLIGWAIGFFFYDAGAAIHILLVLALVAVLIRVAQGRSD